MNTNHALGVGLLVVAFVVVVAVFAILVGELSQARARNRVLKAHVDALQRKAVAVDVAAQALANAWRGQDRDQTWVEARQDAAKASARAVVELVKMERLLLGGTWPDGLGRPMLPLTRRLANQVALRAGAALAVRAAVDILMRQVVPNSTVAITFGVQDFQDVEIEPVDFPAPRHTRVY